MSYYNTGVAPSYPFTPAAIVVPADNNLAAGASPQQVGIPSTYQDASGMPALVAVSNTITPDLSVNDCYIFTLTANTTIANPVNAYAGMRLQLELVQDGTGSRTGTFGSAYKFVGGSKTLTVTASAIDKVDGIFDGTNWLCTLNKAYA